MQERFFHRLHENEQFAKQQLQYAKMQMDLTPDFVFSLSFS
jgi:hypothetical protein